LSRTLENSESFFRDQSLDQGLPAANRVFWSSLIRHIEDEGSATPRIVLDIGCHTGGLLQQLGRRFSPVELIGIEPIAKARAAAYERLKSQASAVHLFGLDGWEKIAAHSVDLLVCHEVLYLEPDLHNFMARVRRILTSDGAAFVVLGCHSENPLWAIWRVQLLAEGIAVHDHKPIDIMAAASAAGLLAAVQPLRRSGWVSYDPPNAAFLYPDVQTMFDHHYRHKLIFRLRSDDDLPIPS
jgi:SAM-dependent methyltransferase